MASFALPAPTSALVVGPHSQLERNGVIFNDRSTQDCYWIDDFTGFGKPDLRVSAQENVQEDGELPDPGFHGGRTMTMIGTVRARNYPTIMNLIAQLEASLIELVELPMVISAINNPSGYFRQDPVSIACRPVDWSVDTKLGDKDIMSFYRRPFTVALRASRPAYRSTTQKHVQIIPTVLSELGFIFPLTFDLVFATYLNAAGDPAPAGNVVVASNLGNWDANPVIRFTGPMSGISLVNSANGDRIHWKYPIVGGDYIEIDIEQGSIKGPLGENRANEFDTSSDWMTLAGKRGASTGNNSLALSVSSFASGAAVDIWWNDTWMSGG